VGAPESLGADPYTYSDRERPWDAVNEKFFTAISFKGNDRRRISAGLYSIRLNIACKMK